MIIDLHSHSNPLSPCSSATSVELIDRSKAAGLDGIVIANHYFKNYAIKNGLTPKEYAAAYIDEFSKAKAYAEKIGYTLIFGIEITAEAFPLAHLLVYGVPFEFLSENPEVYNLSLEEIYRLVKSYGGVLVQAHPFRSGMTVMDTDFLDGVEVNCHPAFGPTYKEKLAEIAEEKGLHVTCGSDFHGKTERTKCGMLVPDNVSDTFSLRDYILSNNEKTLLVHEQGEEEPKYIKVKA